MRPPHPPPLSSQHPPPSNHDWTPPPHPYHPQTSWLAPGLTGCLTPSCPQPLLFNPQGMFLSQYQPFDLLPWNVPDALWPHLPPFLQCGDATELMFFACCKSRKLPIHPRASALSPAYEFACIPVSSNHCHASGFMLCTSSIDILPHSTVKLLLLSYRYLSSQQ